MEDVQHGNIIERVGGGLMSYGPLVVLQCVFDSNVAVAGGGIAIRWGGEFPTYVINSTFSLNLALCGSGVDVFAPDGHTGVLEVRNSICTSGAGIAPPFPEGIARVLEPSPSYPYKRYEPGYSDPNHTYTDTDSWSSRPPENAWSLDLPVVNPNNSKQSRTLRPRYTAATAESPVFVRYGAATWLGSNLLWGAPEAGLFTDVANFLGKAQFQEGTLVPASPSPAIDHGDPFLDFDPLAPGVQGVPALDIDGNPRVVGAKIDMGAFESQGE
jgi:hypothetical protein